MSAPALVSLEDIRAAAERVRGAAVRTPALAVPWPGPDPAHPFFIKCENLQPMGAFKVRGAFMSRCAPRRRSAPGRRPC